jgi:hypothetical protein
MPLIVKVVHLGVYKLLLLKHRGWHGVFVHLLLGKNVPCRLSVGKIPPTSIEMLTWTWLEVLSSEMKPQRLTIRRSYVSRE